MVQFFDRWGNLLGRDHVQMSPHSASWADGRFCVVGWDASGRAKILCGDPLEGEPFVGQSAQLGACAATAYGGALYTSSSEGVLAAQTIGDPASFHDLGKVDSLVNGLLATPRNPSEGGNQVQLCPELLSGGDAAVLPPPGGNPDVEFFRRTLADYAYALGLWHALVAAMENPAGVLGWGRPTDPGRPAGTDKPPVTSLGLEDPGAPYSALWNAIVGRGCLGAQPVMAIPRLCPELVNYEQVHGRAAVTAELHEAVWSMIYERAALATGFGGPADPTRPLGPDNPRQTGLGLHSPAQPWDPLANPLVYKACASDGAAD